MVTMATVTMVTVVILITIISKKMLIFYERCFVDLKNREILA